MSVKTIRLLLFTLLALLYGTQVIAEEEPAKDPQPGYVSLGETMVLNLSTDGRKLSFLQLKADVLVGDDDSKSVVESHLPAIRHQLIVMLSEQSATDMKTPAKREQVRQQVTTQVRDMLKEMGDNPDVKEVLFSTFLVQ